MNRLFVVGSLLTVASLLPAQGVKPGTTSDETPVKLDGAHGPIPPVAPGVVTPPQAPNSWFPVTEIDLGTFFGAEHAVGLFQFSNPGQEEVMWRSLQGSCTCAKAIIRVADRRYELSSKPTPNLLVRLTRNDAGVEISEPVQQIAVGPGERGEIEVHLDVPNVPGPRQAHLDVHTTDERLPQFKLKWSATSAQLFVVSPPEVNLNKMTWNETRDFNVTVTSPLHPDFNILRMDDAGEAFDVQWEKSEVGGRAAWTIKGKYGPVGSEIAGGGVLKFYSDVRGQTPFSVRVMALVQGPLEIKPGTFLPFGMIRRGNEMVKEILFEPNDGVKLEALKLSFENMTVPDQFVTVTSHNDGNKLVLELKVSADAPGGLLKGELVVDLSHPLVKQKRIVFNGFVR